jgi:hypothetical protein
MTTLRETRIVIVRVDDKVFAECPHTSDEDVSVGSLRLSDGRLTLFLSLGLLPIVVNPGQSLIIELSE